MEEAGASRSLSIVIPCFNEEASIAATVRALSSGGSALVEAGRLGSVEIIAVDDGSTDDTAERLTELSEQFDELRWVGHATNRGLGAAVRSGFEAATGTLLFYTDADLPVAPDVIGEALTLIDSDDRIGAVSAYRSGRQGEGAHRVIYSVVYNALIRMVLGLSIKDVNFAAKLVRSSALDQVDLLSDGSFIDAELLASLHSTGCSIAQFSAEYQPRTHGTSTAASVPVILSTMREMALLSRRLRAARATPSAHGA